MKLLIALDASHLHFGKDTFRKLAKSLQQSRHIYKYVPQELRHIKLLSLNESSAGDILHLNQIITKISKNHEEIELKLNGLWAYPNQEEGRLLWIGVQNSISLRSLQESLARAIVPPKDLWEDNVFKPILPVLRFKNHHNVTDLISPYKGYDFGKNSFHCIVLLEMTKSGSFPEYRVIQKYHLTSKQGRLAISG